jgi:hypothetical protein
LSLSASYCFSFFTLERLLGIDPLLSSDGDTPVCRNKA